MRRIAPLLSIALLSGAGCAAPAAIDLEAEREALMEADRAWYQSYANSDEPLAATMAGMSDDIAVLAPDMPIVQGHEAVRAMWAELEATPGFSLTWTPLAADVGGGGDLGYTRGSYEMSMAGPDGPMTIVGKYISVWRKQADGSWLVVADMFNADSPPVP